MCDELLAGITVDMDVRQRALAIVRADSAARKELMHAVRVDPSRWYEQGPMIDRRDAEIRLLLPDDAARALFDRNVAARPRSA